MTTTGVHPTQTTRTWEGGVPQRKTNPHYQNRVNLFSRQVNVTNIFYRWQHLCARRKPAWSPNSYQEILGNYMNSELRRRISLGLQPSVEYFFAVDYRGFSLSGTLGRRFWEAWSLFVASYTRSLKKGGSPSTILSLPQSVTIPPLTMHGRYGTKTEGKCLQHSPYLCVGVSK